MTLKDDLKVYRDRWQAVAEIEKRELQAASIEFRWPKDMADIQAVAISHPDLDKEHIRYSS